MPPTILPPPLARGVERAFLEKLRAGEVKVGILFLCLARLVGHTEECDVRKTFVEHLPEATARQAAMTIAALMVNTLKYCSGETGAPL